MRFSPVLCPMSLEFPPYRSNYRSSAASLADHLEDTITLRTFPLLMVRLPSVRTQNAVAAKWPLPAGSDRGACGRIRLSLYT